MRESNISGVLKPGKPEDKVESYRPIYRSEYDIQLLDRLILNRISESSLYTASEREFQSRSQLHRSRTQLLLYRSWNSKSLSLLLLSILSKLSTASNFFSFWIYFYKGPFIAEEVGYNNFK